AAGDHARAPAGSTPGGRPARELARVPAPAAPGRGRARIRAGRGRARTRGGAAVSEPLLLQDIDEPGLHTLAVYERRGGFQALRKALAMTPAEVLSEREASALRGRGGGGFQMGKKVFFLPHGAVERYLVCDAASSG